MLTRIRKFYKGDRCRYTEKVLSHEQPNSFHSTNCGQTAVININANTDEFNQRYSIELDADFVKRLYNHLIEHQEKVELLGGPRG